MGANAIVEKSQKSELVLLETFFSSDPNTFFIFPNTVAYTEFGHTHTLKDQILVFSA